MKLTIGFSPCPNDTFIFDALVNGKIDTGDLEFSPALEDVETLNQWALQGKLDISKMSFPAFFRSANIYELLHAGSALGKGVGPLLISNIDKKYTNEEINSSTILLPGENTTAHLLFSFAYPQAHKKKFMVFHEIEDALVIGAADLGAIIHENRFTYQSKGLHKVKDLGEYWEEKMNVPVPLGGIAIKKSLGENIFSKVNHLICQSLEFSFANYPFVPDYVKCHAQAMSEEVMRKHIGLYVNHYSLNLGEDGLKAIETLQGIYHSIHSGAM